jgi:uncharacterized membrane protein YbhN (UPF0104 family)
MKCSEEVSSPVGGESRPEAERAGPEVVEAYPRTVGAPLWRRILPFFVAGGIITWLFLHIDVRACLNALVSADLSLFVPWLTGFILVTFLLDTVNLSVVLRELGHPLGFRSVLAIRGVTYLLMTIDHTLGLGGLIYYLRRELSLPVMRLAGLMLLFNAVTQFALVVMSIAGLAFIEPTNPILWYFFRGSIVFAGFVVLFVSAMKWLPARMYGDRIRRLSLVSVFHETTWRSYCILLFWRGVYYVPFIVFFYASSRAFGLYIPFAVLTAYVPIILLVISMPVTPGGFGTAQATMVYLLRDYGTGGQIMAFGLAYSTSILVLRSLIGLIFVHSASGHAPGKPAG